MAAGLTRNSTQRFVEAVCLAICCLYTLWNGYPILYSDSSTYLSSGFELETPFDRPITYGILLRIFSLNGITFLLIPIFHGVIFLYVIREALLAFLGDRIHIHLLLTILVIGIFSGFYWSLNELLPDIFTAIGFLCIVLIYVSRSEIKRLIPLSAIFFISAATHLSNVFLFLGIILVALMLRKKFLPGADSKSFFKKTVVLLLLLGISFLIMMSAFSKSRRVFFAGSLADKGILQKILREQCDTYPMQLCPYKDSIPQSFEKFVWNEKSPLYAIGGWKAAKEDLKTAIGLSFSDWKYLSLQIKATANYTAKQLLMFEIGEGNGRFDENTLLIQRIKKYGYLDDKLCTNTLQHEEKFLSLGNVNRVYKITTIISLLTFVFLIFQKRIWTSEIRFITLLALLLILFNAILTAFSSEISNRIGCKLYWLVPFISYLLIAKTVQRHKPPYDSDKG